MNYKESMAAATECGMSHEEASELVNEATDILPEILMNKIQEHMGENVKSVFANIKQSLHSTNYIEDTLANMSRVFNIKFKNKFAGVRTSLGRTTTTSSETLLRIRSSLSQRNLMN